jgi:hypothetical protein
MDLIDQEWVACIKPEQFLQPLRFTAGDRKLRLFACACCHRVWDRFNGDQRHIIILSERVAEGHLGRSELMTALYSRIDYADRRWAYAERRWAIEGGNPLVGAVVATTQFPAVEGAIEAAEAVASVVFRDRGGSLPARDSEKSAQAELLREIVGNPFRPCHFSPRWRTANTVDLARTIYEDRAFDRLPILADALMDAGCAEESILDHCRSPSLHVRGCWVVDLILGRS